MPYRDPDQRRAYAREWFARRRAEILGPDAACLLCGATDELEHHHLVAAEKVTHRFTTWALARARAEMAKCVVLCGSCHDELHAAERRAACGTESAYWRGCRCDRCREAHRVGAAARRRRTKREVPVSDQRREAWLAVVQDEDGSEETELVTIDHSGPAPVIELTDGRRITCIRPATGGDEPRAAA